MPAPLFKRWVPPTPTPKPAPSAAQEKSSSTPVQHVDPSAAAPEHSTPRSAKKEKKRKRESTAHNVNEEEDNTKKHKSVLSKFEKVSKLAEKRSQQKDDDAEAKNDEPQEELHDLQPMPQPDPVPEPAFEPTFSTLPTWLAQPVNVKASKTVPFAELGVDTYFQRKLEKQGFQDALAVQSALLPLLHQGFEQHLGDICVSAKTGSGKTLAYLLPIIEALKDRTVPMLSAIIVVPSRQLVNQALQVAEELCAGTKIKVGTALGNTAFATEQKQLIKVRGRYDPARAKELHEHASRNLQAGVVEKGNILEDLLNMLPDHVPQYESGVDILICTPGRLVEHIEHTTGFFLNHVRWLVIDEADQLLNQNFQGWANTLMEALHGEIPKDFMNERERLLKQERDAHSVWSTILPARRQLTKIVLSATMEKDLTKLGTLRLKRPKLVVVQDESADAQPLEAEENNFELPSTLNELAVHVGDGTNKPLHLLHVLLNFVFRGVESTIEKDVSEGESSDGSSDKSSDSEPEASSMAAQTSRVLIFTKSNENASRLSHLLSVLEPSFKNYLKTMTRTLTAEASKKLLRSFSTGDVKILVASDAVSRGIDIPSITHVINYDVPTSITSYVHRVGRTARAGKPGEAWTLFTKSEAAWFLKQVAKGDTIKRGKKKVKRMEWKESTVTANGRKKAYREALAALEGAVKDSIE